MHREEGRKRRDGCECKEREGRIVVKEERKK